MSEYIFKVTKVATEVHKPLQLLSNHCFCYQQKKLLTEVNLTVDLPFNNDGYYKVSRKKGAKSKYEETYYYYYFFNPLFLSVD